MLKKNSGVKMSATGFIPFSMISNWFVPERMMPAANAPMMRADPARAARAARSNRKANAETRSTPRTRIRFTSPKMRGASAAPSATAATRNPTATASVHTTPTALTAAPAASPGMTPSTLDPRTMPATSSPSTAGCPSRSASSAENLPATSISPSTPKKRTTSPSPAAAPSRSGGRAAQSHALHRLRDVGMELEGVGEEREIDRLAVLRVDLDLAGRSPAHDPHVPRRVRQPDLLHGGLEPALDGAVVERGREARLRLDFVQEAVVAKIHLADVDAVVERRDKDQERKQAASRARAARTSGKAPHHWDWAPSTISFTSFESAIFRPSASLGGSYSPSTVSPWRCHSVLPSRWSRISTSTLIWTRRWVTDTSPRPGWSATGVSGS